MFLKTKYDCCGGFATLIIPWNARHISARGQLVKVGWDRLRGVAGVIQDETKTSLLIPIHSLQTSIAVEIDRTQLLPCAKGEQFGQKLGPLDLTAEK